MFFEEEEDLFHERNFAAEKKMLQGNKKKEIKITGVR